MNRLSFRCFVALAGAGITMLAPALAGAQEYAAPPPSSEFGTGTLHTYLETRIGAATFAQKSAGYGPSLNLAYGMGFSWIDVGAVGSFSMIPNSSTSTSAYQYSLGPEIATRTSIGGGMTFRFGVDPLYTLQTFDGQTTSMVGVDGLAQFLFTLDDTSKPVWRAGVGLHGGRRWPTSGGDGVWMVGADLIIRTWW